MYDANQTDAEDSFFDEGEELPIYDEAETAGPPPRPRTANGGRRFPWKWVLLGCFGLPLISSLVCAGASYFLGLSLLGQLEEELAGIMTAEPIVTLVPTAGLNAPPPAADPAETPSPTPIPAPPSGDFVNLEDGLRIDLDDTIPIELEVQDGSGILTLLINDNGQTIFSERYPGSSEIRFARNWSPLSDGRHFLTAEITNQAGDSYTIASRSIFVLDPDFIQRNLDTFNQVQGNVTALRGLALQEPVYPYLMGVADLRRYLRTGSYTAAVARDDALTFSLFDLVPRGANLFEDGLQFTSTNILGFYDPETAEMAIISNNRDLNELEAYTYAHELMHALQDQYFDLDTLTSQDYRLGSDEYLALRALAEGEAELLQELYLDAGYIDQAGQNEIFNALNKLPRMGQSASLVDVPEILIETAVFPYVDGKDFAQVLYNRFGWEGLNTAWENRPVSTEQILHPQRYIDGDQPQEVALAPSGEALGAAWRLLREDTLGELYLRLMLGTQLNEEDVSYGATGWGGDRYRAYENPDTGALALIWRTAWDNADESAHFASAYEIYAGRAYGENRLDIYPGATCRQSLDVVCSLQLDSDWLIVRAPDAETAAALLTSQSP